LFGTWTYQYAGATAVWTACLLLGLVVAAGFLAMQPAVHRRLGSVAPLPSPG
jgi:hypothetical protein